MKKNSIAKNYIYNLIYQILTIFLPLITTPYLSRVLGAEKIGIYSYTLSIATYFILFGTLGISLYAQREIAYEQENQEKRSKIFWEINIFRIITMFISMFFYYIFFINGTNYQLYYKILLIQLIGTCFNITWLFQALEDFKKTATRNIIVKIISLIFIFVFVKSENDLYKYMLIFVLSEFIGNLSLWLYIPKYVIKVKLKNLNIIQHIKPTLWLFIPQIAMQIYTVLDKTMLGNILEDKSEVGYYEQAQKIINLCILIVTSLGLVMVPRMANTYANGKKEELYEYMKTSFKFIYTIAFPIIIGIFIIKDDFVPIFFGKGYGRVSVLIQFLSPIILFIGISNITGTQYLLSTKKQKQFTISVVCGAIINFLLNVLLITNFKAVGASIATVIAEFIVAGIQLLYIKKEFKIMGFFKISKNNIIASALMLISAIILGFIINNKIIKLIMQILISFIVYFFILIILKDEIIKIIIEKVIIIMKKINGLLSKFNNIMKKINIEKFILIFIIIQPIIDSLTAILLKNSDINISLGIIIRSIFMIFIIYYSLLYSSKRQRIILITYYILTLMYFAAFIINTFNINYIKSTIYELKGLIKTFYFPIILSGFVVLYKNQNIKIINKKILIIALLGYILNIFITRVLNIGYASYNIGSNIGTTGLFFAANEIGIIIGMLGMYLFTAIFLEKIENKKYLFLYIISLLLYIFSVLEIGTKVPIISIFIIFIITAIVCLVNIFTINKKIYFRKLILLIFTMATIIIFLPIMPTGKNIQNNYRIKMFNISELILKKEIREKTNIPKKIEEKEKIVEVSLSDRDLFLENNKKDFLNSKINKKILGIGYRNDDYSERKLNEMDYYDIFLIHGILGFSLFFCIYLYICIRIIFKIIINFKNVILNQNIISMCVVIIIAMCVAFVAGHTLTAPGVSIYLGVTICQLYYFLERKELFK